MRKTNKNFKKIASDKSGVILITVIFIVAMALIFITTAMTISIATRRRVYSNAKYQQARLTAVSLAQSIWQAIYSQQISDEMLINLAKGTGGQGSLVHFETDDVPGMGLGGAEATAYFYCVTPGNPSKIGIECKCDIDGASSDGSTQYYTIILERGKGEDIPPAAWRLPFRLGGGASGSAVFNSCNVGLDASQITNTTYDQQVRYQSNDNIAFIHNPAHTTQDQLGLYCKVITDSALFAQNTVFAWDVFYLGENASMDWVGGISSLTSASRTVNVGGSNIPQRPNFYFYGTTNPFTTNGAAIGTDYNFTLRDTVNSITFDIDPSFSGSFSQYTHRIQDNTFPSNVIFETNDSFDHIHVNTTASPNYAYYGYLNYDNNFYNNQLRSSGRDFPSSWETHSSGWESDAADMVSQMYNSSSEMDTIDDVVATYGSHFDGSETVTTLTQARLNNGHEIDPGSYEITGDVTLSSSIDANVEHGNIYIIIRAGAHFYIDNSGAYFTITGNEDINNNVVFLLEPGAQIVIGQGANGMKEYTGIIDERVFNGTDYTDARNLDQTTTPRCQILSLYVGGTPLRYEANNHLVCTAMLGFFPQSDPDAGGGGQLYVRTSPGNASIVYYGRLSVGGVNIDAGGNFNVPYCPPVPNAAALRDYAYRDNTDYQIVETTAGTSGFFTVTP